jgi:transposase
MAFDPGRAPSARACEPFRELIVEALSRGRNAMAIWQDLVDDHGFQGRYASVKRYVRQLRGSTPAEARVVITTAPGEEAQVDYGGDGPMVRDPRTGKYRRVRLFVMTLGHSRKSVRLLVPRSSTQTWAELHEIAFRRLGGATRVVVLDNLREGVIQPDVYDAQLNPLYRDVLAHYGAIALACRVRDPDRKGKVESGVGHAQRTPLKGLRFESIDEAQAYLDRWEERWADTRIHGTSVFALVEAVLAVLARPVAGAGNEQVEDDEGVLHAPPRQGRSGCGSQPCPRGLLMPLPQLSPLGAEVSPFSREARLPFAVGLGPPEPAGRSFALEAGPLGLHDGVRVVAENLRQPRNPPHQRVALFGDVVVSVVVLAGLGSALDRMVEDHVRDVRRHAHLGHVRL